MKKFKLLIVLVMFFALFTGTYCLFTKSVTKTGSIETVETTAVFLDNTNFLTKIQLLDSSITTVDKTNDLNRVTTLPTVTFTSDNLFSDQSSSMPIYVWIDNGTIYYYTGATTVDLNNI